MKVAIASGKGGTGKTLLSTNLACWLACEGLRTVYVDCDVEAPNGHLFLEPQGLENRRFALPLPVVDEAKCVGCGACQQACAFHAILSIAPGEVMVFPELCHSCGGCKIACPEKAISEHPVETGTAYWGTTTLSENLRVLGARLDVGQPRAAPLIESLVKRVPTADIVVIDAPPGTSCNTVAALRGTDHVILVTEPTPFGLHDLRFAVAVCKILDVPCSAVINRADLGDDEVLDFLRTEGVPVVAEIPFERALSDAYVNGKIGYPSSESLRAALARIAASLGLDRLEEVRV